MKVVMATSFPSDPLRPHGGVEAVSVQLTRGLAAFGDLNVQVVTTDRECKVPEIIPWEGATIHRLPWTAGKTLRHFTGPDRQEVLRYIQSLAPDVIHAHDTYGLMVKGLKIPRVFTIHGFIHEDTIYSGQRFARIRSKLWKKVELAGWADQPHIISISPYVRERLKGIATGIIHDIDNPIDESFFGIKRHEQSNVIFSAALLNKRKNPIALVEAVALLKEQGVNAELRLAGRATDQEYFRHMQDRIAACGLENQVKLLGEIDSVAVKKNLSEAAVFSLVSFEEGSPMGIEESMAAGVPVVTSNRCGMPYMLRDGESGFLVDPNDPADIAHRLRQMITNDELRKKMGDESRDIAKARFHPARVAKRTREVYLRAARRIDSQAAAASESGVSQVG
jgi:glycosyltransferase involved in cell wall biosynthesis